MKYFTKIATSFAGLLLAFGVAAGEHPGESADAEHPGDSATTADPAGASHPGADKSAVPGDDHPRQSDKAESKPGEHPGDRVEPGTSEHPGH